LEEVTFMDSSNERKCPFCNSENVKDTGSRAGYVQDYIPGRPVSQPYIPIYRCQEENCGKSFEYLGE